MQQLTAKIYLGDSTTYTGTAWLCSCEYALTAAHCVGNRESKQIFNGEVRLRFENGDELKAIVSSYDFNLDAAILRITAGYVSQEVSVSCGEVPVQRFEHSIWRQKEMLSWEAYGYPQVHDEGMTLSGTITSLNVKVGGAPAIQLLCDEGGKGWLNGASGAAVQFEGKIVGLIRWAPPKLEQLVIFATPISKIAESLPELAQIISENLKKNGYYVPPTPKQSNLPELSSSFIGRGIELANIIGSIEQDNVQVIVLKGEAGAGKTRMALEAGEKLHPKFVDGVFLVKLSTTKEPQKVALLIADSLGVKETEDISLLDSLKLYVRGKNLLLILDGLDDANQEVTLTSYPAAFLLGDLIKSSPQLKVLITSRNKASIEGLNEKSYLVEPLEKSEAVELFCNRVAEVHGYSITSDMMKVGIADICKQVGNLPLAIELVSAQFDANQKVQTVFNDLGRHGDGALHERLLAAVDYVYSRLNSYEQTLLRRLSIFVGSFTERAANEVCRKFADQSGGVKEKLDDFVRKYLLQMDNTADGESRYWMLPTIQRYFHNKMETMSEIVAARRDHSEYYLSLARKAERRMTILSSAERKVWMDELESELENIRAVLELTGDSWSTHDKNIDLAGLLFWFWNLRGFLVEGHRYLTASLKDAYPFPTTEETARALYAVGGLAFLKGDYEEARLWLEESIRMWLHLENRRRLGYSKIILGMVALNQNRLEEAQRNEEESVNLFKEVDDKWGLALSLNDLANVLVEKGEPENLLKGREFYEQALKLWGELDDMWGYSLTQSNLGRLAYWQNNTDLAIPQKEYTEALIKQRIGRDLWGAAHSLKRLASVYAMQKDYVQAVKLYRESLLLHQQLGRKQLIAECLEGLAGIAVSLAGSANQAPKGSASEGLSALWKSRVWHAVNLFGAAAAIRETIKADLTPTRKADFDQRLEEVHKMIDEYVTRDEFERQWDAGRRMTMENAIDSALEFVRSVDTPTTSS